MRQLFLLLTLLLVIQKIDQKLKAQTFCDTLYLANQDTLLINRNHKTANGYLIYQPCQADEKNPKQRILTRRIIGIKKYYKTTLKSNYKIKIKLMNGSKAKGRLVAFRDSSVILSKWNRTFEYPVSVIYEFNLINKRKGFYFTLGGMVLGATTGVLLRSDPTGENDLIGFERVATGILGGLIGGGLGAAIGHGPNWYLISGEQGWYEQVRATLK